MHDISVFLGQHLQLPYLLMAGWSAASLLWRRQLSMSVHAAFMVAVCTSLFLYMAGRPWYAQVSSSAVFAGYALIFWKVGGSNFPRFGGWMAGIGSAWMMFNAVNLPARGQFYSALLVCGLIGAFAMRYALGFHTVNRDSG